MEAPKVFISHASEDKDRFVIPFATRLRENGVDAWVDRWEMNPGDSLVDRIFEEGLKNAAAVIDDYAQLQRRVGAAVANKGLTNGKEIAQDVGVTTFLVRTVLDTFESQGWVRLAKEVGGACLYHRRIRTGEVRR